jgi:hypothetical protein
MYPDIWKGTPFEEMFNTEISPEGYGDPDKSRVAPTGTTTHHDIEAYDEYTAKVNPPDDAEDPNDPYQKVGVAMNHIDERWGENYDEPFGCPPHSDAHISPPPPCVPKPPCHHHHPATVIDTPPMEQITTDDVDEVYGVTEHNMKLLTVSSVRVAKLTQVLKDLENTEQGIDLVKIMERVPFASLTFRAVLEDAFTKEMKNYLAIINKINEYMYGEQPEETPEPEPEPEPVYVRPSVRMRCGSGAVFDWNTPTDTIWR